MFTVLAPVFLAASVLASPALITRQTPAGCQSFPTDGAWNVDNFTLSALLEDDTQKPLALSGNDTTFTLAVRWFSCLFKEIVLTFFYLEDDREYLKPPGYQLHHGLIRRDRSCYEQQRRRESRKHSHGRRILDVRYVTGRLGVCC